MLIDLKNGNARAVADTFGGELISFIDNNSIEYLWNGDETYWSGRSPHLFPIIGTLKNNKALIDGNYFNLMKHGFARNSKFSVYEVTQRSVTFVLKNNENMQKGYPFQFSFYVKHSLEENGFTTSYRVENEGSDNMFFNIGGHVGIRCPLKADENFDDYEILFEKKLTTQAYFPSNDDPITKSLRKDILEQSDTLSLSYDLFEKGAMIMDRIDSHSLQLRNKRNHRGVSFQYEGFPVLALWTLGMKKAPYLCIEPWHGLPAMIDDTENFEDKPYIVTLLPNTTKELQYTVKIL